MKICGEKENRIRSVLVKHDSAEKYFYVCVCGDSTTTRIFKGDVVGSMTLQTLNETFF